MDEMTREEFDRRLDAANERRRQQIAAIEAQQQQMEGLLSHLEEELSAVESGIEQEAETHAKLLRKRLSDLAEQTARVAALV